MTEELLTEIEDLASRLMPLKDIAVITGIDKTTFRTAMLDPESLLYKAYHRGFLKTKAEIRQSIVQHAKAGSSPAQTLADRYIMEIKTEELDDWG